MAKGKKDIKALNAQPLVEAVIEPTVEKFVSTTNPIFAFYFKSLLLGIMFFAAAWFVIVANYTDMTEWEKVYKKNLDGRILTSDEMKLYIQGDKFKETSEFKWLYNYKWIYNNLLSKNLEVQRGLDTMDLSERYLYKLKGDYQYVKLLKDNTPENAVILMPDQSDLVIPQGFPENTPTFKTLTDKAWCYYFLYPRKLVYEVESKDLLDNKPNFRKDPDYIEHRRRVTHVAIVYGKGYDKLNYSPNQTERKAYTVLPINNPEFSNK